MNSLALTSKQSALTRFVSKQTTRFLDSTNICLSVCHFVPHHFHPNYFEALNIEKPVELNSAVYKRQAEFLAGRYAAQQALKHINVPDKQVGRSIERAPVWPPGTIGSISHSDSIAICISSIRQKHIALGVDIEPIMSLGVANDVHRLVMSNNERKYFNTLAMNESEAVTFVYSAKESLFKAIFQFIPQYLDFSASEIVHVDERNAHFNIVIPYLLGKNTPTDGVFHGSYTKYNNHYITLIKIKAKGEKTT
ncbi:4'-phosphopantetheinyl transferase superfamily protein [Alteromonas stellipolaris]|jgi:enterobactin synthetase component D|uniref:Enterobactin synthase component D n=1 Tax=Alteromonas stellipolaris TaxID=233316 RepID=A0AAW7YYH9_9ALTE|nr:MULTISPECIES: 4'-phosphopantetheinyl transferase superfamily protein [Alteromonas]ALM92276.1 vulnibactin synthase, phosphopantetheinyl transferase component [Alteromonas stellipolaris LMG 21856]MDO6538597.1 4'-phosphopantetheinyl transferase superfamily protein [Alteromonas stellipolaris]MDO6577465.1 4'-phosphopantetheinyl transferase superfamily protein [Alteromonas stellipolaris]